jgi:D-glycero-D-manno-heptose 1,7-bisphosphate phosphatase
MAGSISALRAVFLDRDGVINRPVVRHGRPYPPASVDELELVPSASAALWQLWHAGFLTIVVTNQPDVARGTCSREAVEAIHARLTELLPLDEIRACYHDDADGCQCRKPRPGMLLAAAARHGLWLPGCYMVGDRWRDVEAGLAAGCRTVWIDYGYRERGPSRPPHAAVGSLAEAVAWILRDRAQRPASAGAMPAEAQRRPGDAPGHRVA